MRKQNLYLNPRNLIKQVVHELRQLKKFLLMFGMDHELRNCKIPLRPLGDVATHTSVDVKMMHVVEVVEVR